MRQADTRLLIVDDEPAFTSVLKEFFEPIGFEVFTTQSPEEALKTAKKQRPKAVILDFNMPKLTGDLFLRELQKICPMVRVIVVSGYTQSEVESKFKGAGYFAFFSKLNLKLEDLRSKVLEALSE